MLLDFIYFISSVLKAPQFLLVMEVLSLSLKIFLLTILIAQGLRTSSSKMSWLLIICVIVGALFTNIAWIASLSHGLFLSFIPKHIIIGIIRISWGFVIVQYQALALFIDTLTEQEFRLKWYQKPFLLISILYFLGFMFIGTMTLLSDYSFAQKIIKSFTAWCSIETFERFSALYSSFVLILPHLFFSLWKFNTRKIPQILKRQLKIFILYLICPYFISDIIAIAPFVTNSFTYVGISTALLTYALYFSMRKMMRLRFLNYKKHVSSTDKFSFLDLFQDVLERFSHVTSTKELGHITQLFFKDAFHIPTGRVSLHLRKLNTNQSSEETPQLSNTESAVENIINSHDITPEITQEINRLKILITDELSFSNFYENKKVTTQLLLFLEKIDADMFIPIYEKGTMCAYIIVERNARQKEFYSKIERDEIVLFASYLSNIINLLQNRNLTTLIEQEKHLHEELYSKHQEINQYKESIRSFMRKSKTRKIGIIFYKNRSFIWGNQAAQELVTININTQAGHPLSKALNDVARQVEKYKSSQTCFANNAEGERIIIFGIPNLERNNIIIIVSYPEISDIIKEQIDLLKNPSRWDYLLYLETTQSGKLINQLIPSKGEMLLNFKIDLLKTALSRKAILLDMPEEDLKSTVEIIHHISLRETLHVLKVQAPVTSSDVAIKLFGINPTFGENRGQPLLEKLNGNGTLFIQNVHFLDRETQNLLAEFIRYGLYYIFKSDQKVSSDVRIIVSTNQDLKTAAQEGKFSKALYHELKKTSVSMPSLLTLSEQELNQLAQGFTKQAVSSPAFNNLLSLTQREKNKLINKGPVSLQEFKGQIQQLLIQKSKKNNIYQETQFNPAYNISDPELVEAAKLGKHALREPKMMAILWKKFKNQNKIATFLGVNRSSVNRRCKEYNLIDQK